MPSTNPHHVHAPVHVRLLPGQLAPLTVAMLLANTLPGERAQGHHPAALLSLWLYLTITLLGERAQGDHPAALRLHSAHLCGSHVENNQGCSCSLRPTSRWLPGGPHMPHRLPNCPKLRPASAHMRPRPISRSGGSGRPYRSRFRPIRPINRRPLGVRLPPRLGVRAHRRPRECQRVHRLARGGRVYVYVCAATELYVQLLSCVPMDSSTRPRSACCVPLVLERPALG